VAAVAVAATFEVVQGHASLPRLEKLILPLFAGVLSVGIVAGLFEALTDRDWSLQGWEWLDVFAIALLLVGTARWILVLVATRLVPKRERTRPRQHTESPRPTIDTPSPRTSEADSVRSENRRLHEEIEVQREQLKAFKRSRWWRMHPGVLTRKLWSGLPSLRRSARGSAPTARVEANPDAGHSVARRFQEEVVDPGAFTVNWFMPSIPVWEPFVHELEGEAANVLEIGSFEGLSACYFLWRLPDAQVTCVDTFGGNPEHDTFGYSVSNLEQVFDRNVALVDAGRVRKLIGESRRVLPDLTAQPVRFDLVFVDGSHEGLDVLVDASLSWQLLAPNGLLIFDDYEWAMRGQDPLLRPGPAIDAFIHMVEDHCDVLVRETQVILRRPN
jgi:predicted O-methyltransferase YrrM